MEERGEYGRDHRDRRDEDRHDKRGDHESWGEQPKRRTTKRSFLSDLMEGFGD